MDYEYLTVGMIRKACKCNSYILLTNFIGFKIGVNCKAIFIGKNKTKPDDLLTEFTGFAPCDYHTYLNYKHPFVVN